MVPVGDHHGPILIERDAHRVRVPDIAIWQDVVNVPARGQVRVQIAFDDFAGLSVDHCHILDHEDMGRMGVVEAR